MFTNPHSSAGSCLRGIVEGPRQQMVVLGGAARSHAMLCPAGGTRHVGNRHLVCFEAPKGLELPISLTAAPEMINDALDHPQEVAIGHGRIQTRCWTGEVQSFRNDRITPMTAPPDSDALARIGQRLASSRPPHEPAAVHRRILYFSTALRQQSTRRLQRTAESLIGLGLGSTPAGDDMVAAATATLAAAPTPTPRTAAQLRILRKVALWSGIDTTPMSAALLHCAARGQAIAALRTLIAATAGVGDADRACGDLLAVGHSSGYFLALGVHRAAAAVLGDIDSQPADLGCRADASSGDSAAGMRNTPQLSPQSVVVAGGG